MTHDAFARRSIFLTAALLIVGPAVVRGQSFGESVVIADGRILVGESRSERTPGAVYVFVRDGEEWVETGVLEGPDPRPRDSFGQTLALAGSTLFVGAPADRDGQGLVHVYDAADDGWEPRGALRRAGSSGFGSVLAAHGDHLLIGEPDEEAGGTVVHAFRRGDDGEWTRIGELAPPAGAPVSEGFGAAIALADDLALIGAPGEATRRGAAYLFAFTEGWALSTRLAPPEDLGPGAQAGTAVAFAGDEILVGAPGADRFVGTVLRYTAGEDEVAAYRGRVDPEGMEPPVGFGAALAVSEDGVLVGAPAVGRGFGRVFALEATSGGWRVARALDFEGEGRIEAGGVLALADGIGVVGLPADEFGAGTAWVVEGAAGGWEPAARIFSEQVGLEAITGGQIDCAAGKAEGFDCDEVDLLAFVPRETLGAGRGSRLNDVWGWTDPETGREYAIVGAMDGTSFVDVTDPNGPRVLGWLPKTSGSQSNTWRDMKVYRDHVYIVADGAGDHGMQIFDLTELRDVTDPREFTESGHYGEIASAHNLIINEDTGFAYAVGASGGGETCGGGYHMIDIREPLDPTFAGCFAHENTGRRSTGGSHDAQCVVYHGPDPDYQGREICIGANETALSIADLTDKGDPVPIATASYPNIAYAHQGWLTEDHRYFYSNDELDEVQGLVEATRTLVWDLEDLDDPTLIREYYSDTRVTDHNLYVAGTKMYMSNNRAGLRVIDVSDPENPTEIGYFDTTPWSEDAAGFDGTWSVYPYFDSGVILLSSRREGLFLVKPREQRLVP
ncbi:MAG: choice-of-anchor B family protein [Gemmatimonadota bacterium]|nr:choice-of-anchor B family protein [Gemmatimonadota bacterium]